MAKASPHSPADESGKPPRPGPALPPLYAVFTWVLAVVLVAIFGLQAQDAWNNINTQQITEARRSARFVVQGITRELGEQRRMMALFTRLNEAKIRNLLKNPQAEQSHQALHEAVTDFFPDAFAFTLADPSGKPLIDDFDGLVGDVCRNNIIHFAHQGHGQPLFIHPHPEVYHFDLMMPFGDHIFFISLRPDNLIRWLRENAALDQQLFLVKEQTRLIELGARGSRLELGRDFQLSEEEEASLLLRLPIPDTLWRLVVLPDMNQVRQQQRGVITSFMVRSIGILILTALMLWLLGRQGKQRRQAEAEIQDLAQLSYTDPLTGLPNRRALDQTLNREWHWMQRTDEPLSLMMVDIDHFKNYNDHHGHPQGDHAIRTVAQALAKVAIRPRDLVGRFGGEEFLVILPNTESQAANHVASYMHKAIHDLNLPHGASPASSQVSVSIGIVTANRNATESPAQLLEQADKALYAAKASGRNTTKIYPADSEVPKVHH